MGDLVPTGLGKSSKTTSSFSLTCDWEIPNFDKLKDSAVGFEIESPVFQHPEKPEMGWTLSMHPNGEEEKSQGAISFYIQPDALPAGVRWLRVLFDMDVGGNFNHFGASITESGYGWDSYAKHDELRLSRNGTLLVRVTIDWGDKISPDLSNVLYQDDLADITLTVGTQRIPAHRAILAAQSPVFEAMFDHKDFAESRNKEVEMKEVAETEAEAKAAVEQFLKFLYTGSFDDDEDGPPLEALVRLGDRYDVDALKYTAETQLLSRLSGTTFCAVARLHRHSERIFQSCQEFVAEKREEIPAAEWEALQAEDPAFCLKLLDHFVPVAKKPRKE